MATKKKKIAIVGFAASSMHEAPFQDETWEIWGLNELWRAIPKRKDEQPAWDVWLDVHPRWSWERRPGHVAWMQQQDQGKPIYMQEHYDEIPASVPLPLDDLLREFGPYFTCGPAYMLAMAILQQPGQIGVWGIDMLHDTEFSYQRPCIDYFLGIARGRTISVYVPEVSSLGKANGLYGYDTLGPRKRRYVSSRVKKRRQQIATQRDDALRAIYNIDGALETVGQFGIKDDLIKMMGVALNENQKAMTEEQGVILTSVLENYRQGLSNLVGEQREKGLQVLYSLDGSLQELEYWGDVARHLERRGV